MNNAERDTLPDLRLPGISRRNVIKTIAGIALGASSNILQPTVQGYVSTVDCAIDRRWPRPSPYSEYTQDLQGYIRLAPQDKAALLSSAFVEVIQPTAFERFPASLDSETLFQGSLTLENKAYVRLDLSGNYDEKISHRVVKVKMNGKQYYVPIIQSRLNNSAMMKFGNLPEGIYEFEGLKTNFSGELTGENIGVAFSSVQGDEFYNAIIALIPDLHIDEKNKDPLNITKNMPVSAYGYIRRNDQNDYVAEYWEECLGQRGGTKLCRALPARATSTDHDVLILAWLTEQGLLSQRANQVIHHGIDIFEAHQVPVPVEEDANVDLEIDGENNMSTREIKTEQIIALFTDFFTDEESEERKDFKIANQVLGFRQRVLTGEIDALESNRRFVEKYIQRVLGGENLIDDYLTR